MNLLERLQGLFHEALKWLVPDPTPFAALVKPAQDARFGDYQANCAMSLAKQLGQKPREIAQKIIEALPAGDMLETPEIAGPGFINLKLKKDWLAAELRKMATDERLGVTKATKPLTYVIDYSSPNVAKPMHIGHIRSTIIGDALARLLRFLGHKVIGDNHLGDWGTQMGMILWGWKNHRDEASYRADPVGELARLYRLAASYIKPIDKYGEKLVKIERMEAAGKKDQTEAVFRQMCLDEGDKANDIPTIEDARQQVARGKPIAEACRLETSKLHSGDLENRQLWQQFMPQCLESLQHIYERLDIHFDVQLGESAYDVMLPGVVEDLVAKGLAVESKGALIVEVKGVPAPFMVRKSDGAYNYATTDLATIKYRVDHFSPNVLLYVVDTRQGDHFKSLFDVAKRWGYAELAMEHIGFGTIMGPDGKPYKTKDGDVVGLESLLDEAVEKAREVIDRESADLPVEERGKVAEIVGLGAVKYADLSQNRTSDYEFSWDKMLAMNGNTGTYMQYAYTRNCGIFRKADRDPGQLRRQPPALLLATSHERDLALQLLRLPEALVAAAADYKPNLITAYLWDLARFYSAFFQNCPVIRAESDELRESRLLLCDLTARVIQRGLDLLGIRTAERM